MDWRTVDNIALLFVFIGLSISFIGCILGFVSLFLRHYQ
jgi:ABC-type lipoprotein release transport system permease subunit